ncbi:MAG: hypothetical protein KDC52_01995 [Ignavibacteriae bacterium]|nr:hypothetical protein [Ignavibacteriota bacterium]MCB0821364.1 hypothetical protein [Bacteroidales bacterium]
MYYYGKFHLSALRQAFRLLNRRMVKWAFNKYKRFKRTKSLRTAMLWLRQVSKHYAYLFPHWLLGFRPSVDYEEPYESRGSRTVL